MARLCWTLTTVLLAGCALVAPLPEETSIEQRLSVFPTSGLPLEGRVTVHWDEHQIPFIEAEHDGDAAFALGLVHAHLRLGQMEAYRRVAQGRVAEMVGPFGTDIDHALRILDFGRAAAEIEAGLPPATRAWLERFVAGINHHLETAGELPYEFAALGLEREPWSIRDVLAFGRLAGTDVNWLEWLDLLGLRGRDDWPALWARLIEAGSSSATSFGAGETAAHLRTLLGGLSRSGSNSLAVAPGMSATGAAIMANDPHLGIRLPN
ncbi:MAG: penicillin acylase family protein, partial [Defluviicoccus sp.]|nr:penicillin acylase family protein [Defluviicoccus sp.]